MAKKPVKPKKPAKPKKPVAVASVGVLGEGAGGVPQNYQEWVRYHQRAGHTLPSDGNQLRAAYLKFAEAHKVGPYSKQAEAKQEAAQQATVDTAMSTYQPFDFNAKDASYLNTEAGLREWLRNKYGVDPEGRQVGDGTAQRNLARLQSDNQAQIARSAYDYERSLQRIDAAAAARGMFRSGARDMQRQHAVDQRTDFVNQLSRNYARASQDVAAAVRRAINSYSQQMNTAQGEQDQRNLERSRTTNYAGV